MYMKIYRFQNLHRSAVPRASNTFTNRAGKVFRTFNSDVKSFENSRCSQRHGRCTTAVNERIHSQALHILAEVLQEKVDHCILVSRLQRTAHCEKYVVHHQRSLQLLHSDHLYGSSHFSRYK